MCFYTKQTKTATELKNRFKANFKQEHEYQPFGMVSGFAHPRVPVITHAAPHDIQLFTWGLLPSWAKDRSLQKNTLNARIETIAEKPSFRGYVNNRCLVLIDGFFEWQWLDEKGKQKQKYELSMQGHEAFALAGLWNEWIDKETGEVVPTFTILTTEATGIMAEIHNSKKRMPVMLPAEQEQTWIERGHFDSTPVTILSEKCF